MQPNKEIPVEERPFFKVQELLSEGRNFFSLDICEADAAATLRGEKTAIVVPMDTHINKGDFLVFHHDLRNYWAPSLLDLERQLFEVSFCSYHTDFVLVCFRRRTDLVFRNGYMGGEFSEDTILSTNVEQS